MLFKDLLDVIDDNEVIDFAADIDVDGEPVISVAVMI